jgi:hypothetical protein
VSKYNFKPDHAAWLFAEWRGLLHLGSLAL